MSKADDRPITKKDLENTLEIFGAKLAMTITKTLRDEFHGELKDAIAASEQRMMDYMDQLVADQSLEITNAVAAMIQPLQKKIPNHERRVTRLEKQLT